MKTQIDRAMDRLSDFTKPFAITYTNAQQEALKKSGPAMLEIFPRLEKFFEENHITSKKEREKVVDMLEEAYLFGAGVPYTKEQRGDTDGADTTE